MTTRTLVITASILGENGQSKALAERFIAQAESRDGVEVTHRDLVASELPHLNLAELGSWQVAEEERTPAAELGQVEDRKSTRLNSSHVRTTYAVFCLK